MNDSTPATDVSADTSDTPTSFVHSVVFSTEPRSGAVQGLSTGTLFAERYELVRKLGEGGMGQVWLAQQISPVRRSVALKLIKAGMYDESVLQRFHAERQSLAIMEHPAIAKVFDAGTTPLGQPYFVMEYVQGLPITLFCDEHWLNVDERLALFIQVCEGVQHAHQKAIIHRDLKPANILVISVDGKPVPRIIDFGLARPALTGSPEHALLTQFGQLMGTPGYMSPEQMDPRFTDIDTRADVYSLGVILYELLTGMLPFERPGGHKMPLDEVLRQAREDEPPRPSAKVSGSRQTANALARKRRTMPRQLVTLLHGDLDCITMKALEGQRGRRYGAPLELAVDLQRYLNHEPVGARPASTSYQIRKYLRRHRVAAAALSAVVVALSAGLVLALWQAQVARTAAREARAQELQVRRTSALATEQSAYAAAQLGQTTTAIARLAYAVRLDPENPALRTELLTLLDQQVMWWLPQGPPMPQGGLSSLDISSDERRLVTAASDGSATIWDLRAGQPREATIHHGAGINDVWFSPDGLRVVSFSEDHTARVWDAASGQALGSSMTHGASVNDGGFSADGNRVVTASEDHTAQVWDWRTGHRLGPPMAHAAAVANAQFSPDDSRVLTVSADNTVHLWDASARPVGQAMKHGGKIASATFSRDGRRIATASFDHTARIWDAFTGRPLSPPLRHDAEVTRAEFSPDGGRVVTVSWDRTIRLWDAATGKPLGEPMRHTLTAYKAAFSSDGQRILSIGQDGTLREWDGHSARLIGAPVRLASRVRTSYILDGGTKLITADPAGATQLWERRSNPAPRPALQVDAAMSIAIDAGQQQVLSFHEGQSTPAQVWDLLTGRLLFSPNCAHSAVSDAGYDSKVRTLVLVCHDHTVELWNATTGHIIGAPLRPGRPLLMAQFNADKSRFIIATIDGMVTQWHADTGEAIGTPLVIGTKLKLCELSSDGYSLIAATDSSGVQIWDLRTGLKVGDALPDDFTRWTSVLRFSADGRLMLSRTATTLRVWDVHSGSLVGREILHGAEDGDADISPDGTRVVVTATVEGTARLFDTSTSLPVGSVMTHDAGIARVRFSPDSTRIVTSGLGETARLWNGRTGEPIGVPMRHEGNVWSIVFSPDGNMLATASFDQTARLWDAHTGLPLSGPMSHDWPLHDAWFSSDGRSIVTQAFGSKRYRSWPIESAGAEDAALLADLAEVIGGFRVDESNAVVPVKDRWQKLEALRALARTRTARARDIDRLLGRL